MTITVPRDLEISGWRLAGYSRVSGQEGPFSLG